MHILEKRLSQIHLTEWAERRVAKKEHFIVGNSAENRVCEGRFSQKLFLLKGPEELRLQLNLTFHGGING